MSGISITNHLYSVQDCELPSCSIEPGEGSAYSEAFRQTLDSLIQHRGLDPAEIIRYFDESDIQTVNRQYPIVGVYFGGARQTAQATSAVEQLIGWSIFVLPVVSDITRYRQWVPRILHAINGMAIDTDEPNFDPMAMRLLEALRLIRSRRQVFISYMRGESRDVALQLFYALQDHSFEAFLDTHSVQAGVRFQHDLWDRMNDCDLVILLDTENARDRHWVAEEIAKAKHMGLGIFQLIWPGVLRSAETATCEPQYLDESDLVDPEDPHSTLTERALAHVMSQIERYRARSFSARRTRLVERFYNLAHAAGLRPRIASPHRIDVVDPAGNAYWVMPVIGHVHSDRIEQESADATVPPARRRLLYDDQGLRTDRLAHLTWLNDQLSNATRSISLDASKAWIQNLRYLR